MSSAIPQPSSSTPDVPNSAAAGSTTLAIEPSLMADAFLSAAAAHTLLDADTGVIVAANSAFHVLAAVDPREPLAGQVFGGLALMRDKTELCAALLALAPESTIADVPVEDRAADGARRTLEVSATAFTSAGRRVVSCSLRDVTTARIHERRRRQAEKMEALRVLAGSAGHDFNNILSCVRGYISIALETAGTPEPLRQILIRIQDAGVRGGKLPQRLLGFSRQPKLSLQTVELQSWIVALAPQFQVGHPEGTTFEIVAGTTALPVAADAELLRQALMLLITNAREATNGRGRITISATPWVLPAAGAHLAQPQPVEHFARLSVRDSGSGMSATTQARLFEPGFTTKRSGGGAGSSLSTVYRIVALHGGWIDVETEEGRGSEFTLVLPLGATGQ